MRTRVIGLAVGAALLVIVLAAVPIIALLHSRAYAEADQRATYAVQSTADYLSTAPRDDVLLAPYVRRLRDRDDPPVTVIMADGTQVGEKLSPAVTKAVLADVDRPRLGSDDDDDALSDVSTPYVGPVPGGHAVQIFVRTPRGVVRAVTVVRDSDIRGLLLSQYTVAAALAGALLLLAWIAAEVTGRRMVRPLQRTALTAIALRDGDMTARAPEDGPNEVAAVAIELNALASRISELLRQEREAAADLSHRLRTPLTSVRLSVERLPEGRDRTELEAGLDRLERTLTQVIRTTRRGVREGIHPRCDATDVTAERVAFWRPLVEDQERRMSVSLPTGPLWVRCTADDLGAALDALIENVVAHTEDGTAFSVSLQEAPYGADLTVTDEGRGIPSVAVARGRSDRGSSGIGLAIAQSVAAGTGGALDLVGADAAGRARGVVLRLHRDTTQGGPVRRLPQPDLT